MNEMMTNGTIDSRYYFDVTPFHPSPAPGEALTGYLARLAHANRVVSLAHLGAIAFPGYPTQNPANLVHADSFFRPSTWAGGALPTAVRCLTFYHLSRKFSHGSTSMHPRATLVGAIADNLRYCPACVRERPFYRLIWRFAWLPGCPAHACRLLDTCGHCSFPVPLLAPPFVVGRCPTCGEDLASCLSEGLTPDESKKVSSRADDLAFLLSYQPCEEDMARTVAVVARNLQGLRRARGLTRQEAALHLEVEATTIDTLEKMHQRIGSGHSFRRYTAYADLLGIDLHDLFAPLPLRMKGEDRRADELLRDVRAAIEGLRARGERVTRASIAAVLGLHVNTFRWDMRRHSAVRALVEEHTPAPRWTRPPSEDELLALVRSIIADLEARGEPITLAAICTSGRVNKNTLRKHARVAQFLDANGLLSAAPLYAKEEDVLRRVRQAYESAVASGQLVDPMDIVRAVGDTSSRLRYYPRVRAFLDDVGAAYKVGARDQRDSALRARAAEAVAALTASGDVVTMVAIARLVGVTERMLGTYPRTRALVRARVTRRRAGTSARGKDDGDGEGRNDEQ